MDAMFERIHRVGIVPVIKITHPDQATPLARALDQGGIPVAEVTFRTEHAAEAIRRITREMPGMLTGAGTVTRIEQVDQALEAGAQFVVTPGFNPKVVDHCIKRGIPVVPGAPTTSDIEQALERGLKVVKFFPAEAMGGLPYIKAVAAPYAGLSFMPTGGVNPGNLADYLTHPRVLACGGSWMVDAKLIGSGQYEEITRLCLEAVNLAIGLRILRMGIRAASESDAAKSAGLFSALLGVPTAETPEGHAVDTHIEILKAAGTNERGRLVLGCSNLERARFQLERRGFAFASEEPETDAAGKRILRLKEIIAGLSLTLTEI